MARLQKHELVQPIKKLDSTVFPLALKNLSFQLTLVEIPITFSMQRLTVQFPSAILFLYEKNTPVRH